MKKRLTKQERIAESQKKALALQRKLSATGQRFSDFSERLQRENLQKKQMGDKNTRTQNLEEFKRLYDADERAYKAYQKHMRREFGSSIERSSISYASRKYKKGFADSQYVKDMYAEKYNKLGLKPA